ncbi:AsmA-like C-terminal domain-containing protein [Hyphomonas sp.]|uniref:YhdP family protein n=1 Tax=Hyphomonas sp. TaxID=87 RepID=UPI00391CE75E
MVRQTAVVIFLEILGALILLALVLAGLLFLRLSSGPIDLAPFRDDVERALAETREGRPVSLGALQLEWSRGSRRVEITAQDVRLYDHARQPVAEARAAQITLVGSSLLFGQAEVLAIDLSEGWIALDPLPDGRWALAAEPLPPFAPTRDLPDTPQGWIDYTGEVLPAWLRALREAGGGLTLERAAFEGFEVRIRNEGRAITGQVDDAAGRIERKEAGLTLALSGNGQGAGLPGAIRLQMSLLDAERRVEAELALDAWPLGDLAERLGVAPEAAEGLVSAIAVTAGLSEEDGLEHVRIETQSGAGLIGLADMMLEVRDLGLELSYDRAADRMELTLATRGAGPVTGTAAIGIDAALRGEGPRPFEMTSPALTLNLAPMFEGPLDLASLRIAGEADIDALSVSGMTAEFASSGAAFRVDGALARTPARQPGQPPLLGAINFSVNGAITPETVYAFWPVQLGDGARSFAVQRISGGTVHDIRGRLRLEGDSLQNGSLKDDHLALTFRAEDVTVAFLDDLPPVTNAFGRGELTGNSFRLIADRAQFSGWQVSEGLVHLPAFWPRGEEMRVFGRASGPAHRLMRTLVESRLAIEFDPARLSGEGEGTFEMFRPALNEVPYEDVRFSATGTAREVGLRAAALGYDLTGGAVTVTVDQAGAEIRGDGQLGPAPVSFRWTQAFMTGNARSDLTARGTVTPDFLNRFGITGRAYMSGEAPFEATVQLDGPDVAQSRVRADLSAARLDLSEFGWIKPAGEQAAATIDHREVDGRTVSSVSFRSPSARLDGDLTLGADSRLVAATLREAFLRNSAEVSGSVARERDNSLTVTLAGRYLDISGVLSGLGAASAAAEDDGVPMRLAASVDRLTVRPGLDLRQARLMAASGRSGLQTLEASGQTAGGAPLEARLDATGNGPARLDVTSGDAGFLTGAILGADFLSGGQMVISGTLEKDGQPADLALQITNARMREAPFLTQILSLASLRGLTDTLGGEGVLFSRIDIPLKVSGSRYVVSGAKAQGPALGLTASGFVDTRTTDLQLDGVLVPSFGVNSALGGIPILGDLVVGRDGEGVFSLTYSVRGTLDKANVAVNPLSALAPGVIRRIFENPSDTRIPEAMPRPPDKPIPTELPPIKEETF